MSAALLVALLVKSSVVAGLGLALSHLVARRPEDRVEVLRATACILLALPVLMTFGPALSLALLPATAPAAPPPALWSGDLHPVEGNSDSFVLIETWASKAALKDHHAAPHMLEAAKHNPTFRAGPSNVLVLEPAVQAR